MTSVIYCLGLRRSVKLERQAGSEGQRTHVVQDHLPLYGQHSCAEYSTSTYYISPTKRGTDTKH